ncbi:unnamed protein product [Camellia sinensis]
MGGSAIKYSKTHASLTTPLRIKKCPPQKDINMEAMDRKSVIKPIRSIAGNLRRKSMAWCRVVRMARKMINAVSEKQSAASDEVEKTPNMPCCMRTGTPLS